MLIHRLWGLQERLGPSGGNVAELWSGARRASGSQTVVGLPVLVRGRGRSGKSVRPVISRLEVRKGHGATRWRCAGGTTNEGVSPFPRARDALRVAGTRAVGWGPCPGCCHRGGCHSRESRGKMHASSCKVRRVGRGQGGLSHIPWRPRKVRPRLLGGPRSC